MRAVSFSRVARCVLTTPVAIWAAWLFPASFRTHTGEVGLYFEAAAVVVTLILLGQVLERMLTSRTTLDDDHVEELGRTFARAARLFVQGRVVERARRVVAGEAQHDQA